MKAEKSCRAHASQFFVAGELCRRGYSAVVTLGNTPNVDILCSNIEGTKFVHIQVKTFEPGARTCTVGIKATKDFGPRFFWILCGIPSGDSPWPLEFYVIPSKDIAKNVAESHDIWLKQPGKHNRSHKDNTVRVVFLPPHKSLNGWDISEYKSRWDLIAVQLK